MGDAVRQLSSGGGFIPGEVPDYVKAEALAVAKKVQAVQTAKTVTSIVWSDAHHAASQSTGWAAQTNISSKHAAMGAAAVAAMVPVDFCAFCGDYTFGNADTTLALFEEQCKELNRYMDQAWKGIPAFYCVGNHDTGEYVHRDGGELYGAAKIYELIGGRNADGVTVMGSTTYGYCYRDLTAKKTRIIVLNTVEGETTGGISGGQCSDAQLLWFAQKLYEIGSNADWNIIVLSHYPLDYGGTYKAGNLVYEYVNGGSVTYNGTTVNFSGHNLAKFVAQYHGHTHCFKTAKLNQIQNSAGTEFNAWRLATPSGIYYRNNEYAGQLIYGIDFGEETTYTKTADSGDDTAFVVNVYDPEKDVIYSICYGAGYDRTVSIGATVYRTVTATLTNCTSDNDAVAVENGDSYNAIITANSGYSIDSISVTMGNVDITSTAVSGGTIAIASVTGDIVITAVATKVYNYTNLVPLAQDASGNIAPYENGKSISSSGAAGSYTGYILTGFIPLANSNVKHVYRIGGTGISWASSDGYNRIAWYDSSHALLNSPIASNKIDASQYFPSSVSEAGDLAAAAFKVVKGDGTTVVSNVPASAAYFRIGAKGTDGSKLIVTLDQIIDEL